MKHAYRKIPVNANASISRPAKKSTEIFSLKELKAGVREITAQGQCWADGRKSFEGFSRPEIGARRSIGQYGLFLLIRCPCLEGPLLPARSYRNSPASHD